MRRRGSMIFTAAVWAVFAVWAILSSVLGDGCACRAALTTDECINAGGKVEWRWDFGRACTLPRGLGNGPSTAPVGVRP